MRKRDFTASIGEGCVYSFCPEIILLSGGHGEGQFFETLNGT